MTPLIRLFLILVFTCYLINSSIGQSIEDADSLLDNVYTHLPDDTNKINLLYKIGTELRLKNNLMAMRYAEHALAVAEKTESKTHLVKVKSLIGIINYRVGRHKKALELYHEVETLAKDLNDKKLIAFNNLNIANVYIAQNKDEHSERLLLSSLDYFNKVNDFENIAAILNRLGVIRMKLNQLVSAEEFFKKGLENVAKCTDYEMNMTLNSNLGSLYERQEKYERAADYYNEAYKWANLMDNEFEIADAKNNLAFAYTALNKLAEAENFAREALKLSIKNDYTDGKIDAYEALKDIFITAANKDSAIAYQEKFYENTIARNEAKFQSGAYNSTVVDDVKVYELKNEIYLLKYIIGVLSLFLVLLFIALRRVK